MSSFKLFRERYEGILDDPRAYDDPAYSLWVWGAIDGEEVVVLDWSWRPSSADPTQYGYDVQPIVVEYPFTLRRIHDAIKKAEKKRTVMFLEILFTSKIIFTISSMTTGSRVHITLNTTYRLYSKINMSLIFQTLSTTRLKNF